MSKPHIEHEEPVQDGLSRTLKDLFAGAVGGVAQVLSLLRQFSTQTEPHFLGTHTLTSYPHTCRLGYKQHHNTLVPWMLRPKSTKMKEHLLSTRVR